MTHEIRKRSKAIAEGMQTLERSQEELRLALLNGGSAEKTAALKALTDAAAAVEKAKSGPDVIDCHFCQRQDIPCDEGGWLILTIAVVAHHLKRRDDDGVLHDSVRSHEYERGKEAVLCICGECRKGYDPLQHLPGFAARES